MGLGMNCSGLMYASVKPVFLTFQPSCFQEVKKEGRMPWPFWRSSSENLGLLRHQSDVQENISIT